MVSLWPTPSGLGTGFASVVYLDGISGATDQGESHLSQAKILQGFEQ